MKTSKNLVHLIVLAPLLNSCSVDFAKVEKKAAMVNHYETVSLKLAKENRELKAEIHRLEFEIEKLKQDKAFFTAQGGRKGHDSAHGEVVAEHGTSKHTEVTHENAHGESHEVKREVASVHPMPEKEGKDYVEFKTYKWHAEDMQSIADKEFKEKHYEKAAQFYYSLQLNYPHFKGINDEFYFKAGIAAYESGTHHEWTLNHFETLMKKYPTSQYYRSAKLWVGLTHLKLGDKKKFFATVEEFRKKYRNTNEWKILSSYYEKIEEKTNE